MEIEIKTGLDGYYCSRCGAKVEKPDIHIEWHKNLNEFCQSVIISQAIGS